MEDVRQLYFEWLTSLVCSDDEYARFYNLLSHLYQREFYWSVNNDFNRAADGIDMRSTFADANGLDYNYIRTDLAGPCSVLEMLVALAYRIENSIMGDADFGDRTGYWFWCMIGNLGLTKMTYNRFNRAECDEILDIFLQRLYDEHGDCNVFYVENPLTDMRKAEIWLQMCWWLNENEG
jgi:hypothetical protein